MVRETASTEEQYRNEIQRMQQQASEKARLDIERDSERARQAQASLELALAEERERVVSQVEAAAERERQAARVALEDNAAREDSYRRQIAQLQQENQHIQDILLARRDDADAQETADADQDKDKDTEKERLQQELGALKSLIKEQSARMATASEASTKHIEAAAAEHREALAAKDSQMQMQMQIQMQ